MIIQKIHIDANRFHLTGKLDISIGESRVVSGIAEEAYRYAMRFTN